MVMDYFVAYEAEITQDSYSFRINLAICFGAMRSWLLHSIDPFSQQIISLEVIYTAQTLLGSPILTAIQVLLQLPNHSKFTQPVSITFNHSPKPIRYPTIPTLFALLILSIK